MRCRWLVFATLALICASCDDAASVQQERNSSARRSVTVAAAADLKFALDEVISEFRKAHPPVDVKVTYGSSGSFYAQLSNRAPFDIFFSADIDYPDKLIEAGLASASSRFEYAIGRVVVWAPHGSPIDLEATGIQSLVHPSVRKVAIANPQHAPYGRAAEAAMKSLGVYDRVRDRLVLGENVAQTAQFVESGAAEVGIIALSLAMAPTMRERGHYWLIPDDTHPQLLQGGVIVNWAQDRESADLFKAFVCGPAGRRILNQYGFVLPGE